jgi:outer membrane lipopolysaccharide assembly protein LptE/RlpB
VSSQLVEESQSYRHKSSALIAKEREQDEIQTKLNQKIANIIFRQLSVFDAQRIQQAINLQ